MLCRICFQSQATFHVLDRPSDGGLVESHYCPACYERRYARSPAGRLAAADDPTGPADPPAFPLSRFSLGALMTVAGAFAVLNAALALYLRDTPVVGTPAQVDDRMMKAFLLVNPVFAALVVESACLSWLRRAHLQKITGGAYASRSGGIRRLPEWTIAWEGASRRERAWLILCLAWPLLWLVGFELLGPRRTLFVVVMRHGFWPVAAAHSLIILCGEMILLGGLIAASRRR
jgi:hypothetical protein